MQVIELAQSIRIELMRRVTLAVDAVVAILRLIPAWGHCTAEIVIIVGLMVSTLLAAAKEWWLCVKHAIIYLFIFVIRAVTLATLVKKGQVIEDHR